MLATRASVPDFGLEVVKLGFFWVDHPLDPSVVEILRVSELELVGLNAGCDQALLELNFECGKNAE